MTIIMQVINHKIMEQKSPKLKITPANKATEYFFWLVSVGVCTVKVSRKPTRDERGPNQVWLKPRAKPHPYTAVARVTSSGMGQVRPIQIVQ